MSGFWCAPITKTIMNELALLWYLQGVKIYYKPKDGVTPIGEELDIAPTRLLGNIKYKHIVMTTDKTTSREMLEYLFGNEDYVVEEEQEDIEFRTIRTNTEPKFRYYAMLR